MQGRSQEGGFIGDARNLTFPVSRMIIGCLLMLSGVLTIYVQKRVYVAQQTCSLHCAKVSYPILLKSARVLIYVLVSN